MVRYTLNTASKPMSLADAARSLAAIDLHVFPLKARDKLPLIPKDRGGKGCLDATSDTATVTEWWNAHPEANIGIACGPSRLVVLDIDGDEGSDWLNFLVADFGPFPEHPFSLTRAGGHVMFRAPQGLKIKNRQGYPAPHLDIRADGGYIVAPPSIHPSGHIYRWESGRSPWEIEPPALPEWLLMMLADAPEISPPPARQRKPVMITGSRYAEVALQNACERILNALNGHQQETLTAEAYGIGRLVGSGLIDRSEARSALVDAGLSMANYGRKRWSLPEIQKQIDRKLADGMANPRQMEAA